MWDLWLNLQLSNTHGTTQVVFRRICIYKQSLIPDGNLLGHLQVFCNFFCDDHQPFWHINFFCNWNLQAVWQRLDAARILMVYFHLHYIVQLVETFFFPLWEENLLRSSQNLIWYVVSDLMPSFGEFQKGVNFLWQSTQLHFLSLDGSHSTLWKISEKSTKFLGSYKNPKG